MKTSLWISALILLVAGLIRWHGAGRLDAARIHHDRLTEEHRTAALRPDGTTAAGSMARTKRAAMSGAVAGPGAELAVHQQIKSYAEDMRAIWRAGGQPGADLLHREMTMVRQMGKLDDMQLNNLFVELDGSLGFDDPLFGFVLTFAKEYPAKSLALLEGLPGSIIKKLPAQSLEYALNGVIRDDPDAAIAWVRENPHVAAEVRSVDAGQVLIGGIARQDLKRAFQLMDEFAPVHPSRSAVAIAQSAGTPAERSAVLAAMRQHLATANDPERKKGISDGAISTLTEQALGDGFESAAAWLESAKFTAGETEAFEACLWFGNTGDDTGKWIGWVAEHLPPERAGERIDNLISRWAEADYMAAGKWINHMTDGPAKMAAVRGYAQALAPYEPASAANWALSLPDDASRLELMGKIHAEWQKVDPSAAASFARDHGAGQ